MDEIAADAADRYARNQLEVRRQERSLQAIEASHGGNPHMFNDTTPTSTSTPAVIATH
jgi:hypothetical protein